MKYQPIIGLEIHLQAKTKSKMFCRCDANYFGSAANTHVCPVCMGLPGALPVPNGMALRQCIKLALALNCSINQQSKFDRKNYFYPDLPKGYQISQYDLPIGYQGFLEFDLQGDSRRIRITRVHMEEDTGKSIHTDGETLLDFNKSGIPLIEIVTEPDFAEVAEVTRFARRLKQTVQFLGISNADMEKGQMRFELNISLRKPEEQGLPDYKVEVKNIGSISVLEKVINSEIKRQGELLDQGIKPQQETRGLKDMSGETVSQRIKETAADYRYFPEPDIPLLDFSDDYITEIRNEITELPHAIKDRYIFTYKLEPDTAETLIHSKQRVQWFDAAIDLIAPADKELSKFELERIKAVAKWLVGDVMGLREARKVAFSKLPIQPQDLVDIVELIEQRQISGTIAKQVLEIMFSHMDGRTAKDIIEANNLKLVADTDFIANAAKQAIAANEKVVADLQKNPNAIKFLVGQVMKLTQGKVSPQVAEQELRKLLEQ